MDIINRAAVMFLEGVGGYVVSSWGPELRYYGNN